MLRPEALPHEQVERCLRTGRCIGEASQRQRGDAEFSRVLAWSRTIMSLEVSIFCFHAAANSRTMAEDRM